MLRNINRLLRGKDAQSLVEYVMIIALVSIVLIVALNQLGAGIVAIPIGRVVAVL